MENTKIGARMNTDKYLLIAISLISFSIIQYKPLIKSGFLYIDVGVIFFILIRYLSDYRYSKSRIIISHNESTAIQNKLTLTKADVLTYINTANKNLQKKISGKNLPMDLDDLTYYITSISNHVNDFYGLKEELEYILIRLNREEEIRFINGIILKNKNFLKNALYRTIYNRIILGEKLLIPKDGDDLLSSNNFIMPVFGSGVYLFRTKTQAKMIIFGNRQKRHVLRKIKSFSSGGSLMLNSIICNKVLLYQIY